MGGRVSVCVSVFACLCLCVFVLLVGCSVWPGGWLSREITPLLGNRGGYRRQVFFSKGVQNLFLKSHEITKLRLSL